MYVISSTLAQVPMFNLTSLAFFYGWTNKMQMARLYDWPRCQPLWIFISHQTLVWYLNIKAFIVRNQLSIHTVIGCGEKASFKNIFDNVLSVSSTEYELSCVVVPRFIGTKTAYFTSVLALTAIVILFQSIHSLMVVFTCQGSLL